MKEVLNKGKSRRANPAAVGQDGLLDVAYDDVGRQVVTLYQVRDLIATASASITNGTSTVLLAGTTDEFHDLLFISFTSNSTASAVTVDLTDDGTTVRSYIVPVTTTNSGIVQMDYPIPWPQGATGSAWRVDMPDITNTTITVQALFAINV